MTQQGSPLWTTSTSELRLTGTWRSATPVYRNMPSPCRNACPVGGRIAEWIQKINDGDHHGAWLALADNNPFPAISGRICHRPCERACNRLELDDTVGICSLERFIGDRAVAEGWQFPRPVADLDARIAVVGGGPAGLSAAYQLRRRGYGVELFESRRQLGGLLRFGIPNYRLDKKVLDAEIQKIVDLGIAIHLETQIAGGGKLNQLHEEFDAVYLATGASRSKTLPQIDYGQPWVLDSAEFLASSNAGEICDLGQRLLVIGGGSAAMDVARTARRLGRSVTVLSLESAEQLPAQNDEIDEAFEEGVEIITGAMMQSVRSNGSELIVNCIRVGFEPGGAPGEFETTPIAGSEFVLSADVVIPAIGQDADLDCWDGLLKSDGRVLQTGRDWQTNLPGTFAGGDLASMDRFVTQALGMGKEAAIAIAQYLGNQSAEKGCGKRVEVPFAAINSYYYPPSPRHVPPRMPIAHRFDSFDEVQRGLSAHEAVAEASRCFSCGTCTFCDNCYYHCPDMAITKLAHGYEIKTDFCKGCGLCVAECPTGSIFMSTERQ